MTIFMIAVLFQLKHLLADFFWQNHYMLGKFKASGWAAPLAVHSAVHGVMTAVIVIVLTMNPWLTLWCVIGDMVAHFCIDRAKVISSRGLTPENERFWHMIGMDQTLHHLTHYIIIGVVLMSLFPTLSFF